MLSVYTMIMVWRGADKPCVAKWTAKGDKYRAGSFSLAIFRGEHPDEPELASFDHLMVEPGDDGVVITLALTAEDIARAQGPARPEIEHLVYRLRRDGADIYSGLFAIFPKSSQIDAPRKVAARQGVSA